MRAAQPTHTPPSPRQLKKSPNPRAVLPTIHHTIQVTRSATSGSCRRHRPPVPRSSPLVPRMFRAEHSSPKCKARASPNVPCGTSAVVKKIAIIRFSANRVAGRATPSGESNTPPWVALQVTRNQRNPSNALLARHLIHCIARGAAPELRNSTARNGRVELQAEQFPYRGW
jgi:hypothetical protein